MSDKLLKIAGKSKDGYAKALSVELDQDGDGVLRTVNAAPHAYDEESDALKIIDLEDVGDTMFVFADKLELRSTQVQYFNLKDISGLSYEQIRKFKRFKISLTDTHNKSAMVYIHSMTLARNSAYGIEGLLYSNQDITETVSNKIYSCKSVGVGGSDDYISIPALEDIHSNIAIKIAPNGPPTEGDLTIVVECQK